MKVRVTFPLAGRRQGIVPGCKVIDPHLNIPDGGERPDRIDNHSELLNPAR